MSRSRSRLSIKVIDLYSPRKLLSTLSDNDSIYLFEARRYHPSCGQMGGVAGSGLGPGLGVRVGVDVGGESTQSQPGSVQSESCSVSRSVSMSNTEMHDGHVTYATLSPSVSQSFSSAASSSSSSLSLPVTRSPSLSTTSNLAMSRSRSHIDVGHEKREREGEDNGDVKTSNMKTKPRLFSLLADSREDEIRGKESGDYGDANQTDAGVEKSINYSGNVSYSSSMEVVPEDRKKHSWREEKEASDQMKERKEYREGEKVVGV